MLNRTKTNRLRKLKLNEHNATNRAIKIRERKTKPVFTPNRSYKVKIVESIRNSSPVLFLGEDL